MYMWNRKKYELTRIRTWNLLIRSQTRYPLRHKPTAKIFTIWVKLLSLNLFFVQSRSEREREREMNVYLTTHSTHFIYGYMASDIWLRTILIVRKETRCRHIGYSFRLAARVILYALSHTRDNTYHGLCYTSHGALAGTRNSSMAASRQLFSHRITETSCDPLSSTFHNVA